MRKKKKVKKKKWETKLGKIVTISKEGQITYNPSTSADQERYAKEGVYPYSDWLDNLS